MSKVAYRYLQGVKRIVYTDQSDISNKSDQANQSAPQDQDQTQDQEYDAMSLFNTMTSNSNQENNPLNEFGFDSSMYTNTTEEPVVTEYFEDNLYKTDQTQQHTISNIDEFIQYNIDFNNKVSAKEARTSIESRLPFIVDKADFKSFTDQRASKKNKKSAVIRETDSIYKPVVKMRKSGEQNEFNITSSERIGFITVQPAPQLDKNFNTKPSPSQHRPKSATKKMDRIAGILNEKFIITKRKPFNTKKIGYLPVSLSETQPLETLETDPSDQATTATDKNQTAYYDRICTQKKLLEHEQERDQTEPIQRYIQIVESRGIGRFVYIAAIIIVLWFVLNTFKNSGLTEGWSRDGLNIIKTQEQTIETETNIELTMNATPTLSEENKLNLNLTSQSVENISFTVEIIDNETGERVYSTEAQLPSGTSIDTVEINSSLYDNNTGESLYRTATVRCKTYKGNNSQGDNSRGEKYIGEVEQAIEIKIKPNTTN